MLLSWAISPSICVKVPVTVRKNEIYRKNTWIRMNGGLCLETMTHFWEERFHEQKWVLALFKWFQIRCCPDRSHTYERTRRGWTYMTVSLICRNHVFSVTSCATDCFLEDYATLQNRPATSAASQRKSAFTQKCELWSFVLLQVHAGASLLLRHDFVYNLTDTNHFGTWDRLLLSISKMLQIMYTFFKMKTDQTFTNFNVKHGRSYFSIKASCSTL